MVTSLVLYLPVALLVALLLRWSARQSLWVFAGVIGAIRVSAFWFLFFAETTGRQSYALMPLVLLLLPEGYFISKGHNWSVTTGILFSAALLIGSFALASCLTCISAASRRFSKGIDQPNTSADKAANGE